MVVNHEFFGYQWLYSRLIVKTTTEKSSFGFDWRQIDHIYILSSGFWVNNSPIRRFKVTRSLLYLSSGEKRAIYNKSKQREEVKCQNRNSRHKSDDSPVQTTSIRTWMSRNCSCSIRGNFLYRDDKRKWVRKHVKTSRKGEEDGNPSNVAYLECVDTFSVLRIDVIHEMHCYVGLSPVEEGLEVVGKSRRTRRDRLLKSVRRLLLAVFDRNFVSRFTRSNLHNGHPR